MIFAHTPLGLVSHEIDQEKVEKQHDWRNGCDLERNTLKFPLLLLVLVSLSRRQDQK
jgi:hypothetical protein